MAVFIQSAQAISPCDTFQKESIQSIGGSDLSPVQVKGGSYYTCIHPDYKTFIKPNALRRMSPVIRMGLASSKVCMQEAGFDQVDAILVGSGLGCVRDTAKFLNQLIENKELLLNPTAFIQSTHNTVSGQIALMLNCRAHNLTFSQNTLSFETALLEGMLLLKEKGISNILLGGVDEVIEESFLLMQKNDCVRGPQGEGASFFVLSDKRSEQSIARVDGLEIENKNLNKEEVLSNTLAFISEMGLEPADIDLFVSGRNGENRFDGLYGPTEVLFGKQKQVEYKDLVGEYNTASAFGMYLSACMIRDNQRPDIKTDPNHKIKKVLMLNQSKGHDFSWILLSHPET